MPLNPLVDSRDVQFILFEMLGADKLTRFAQFSDFDLDTFQATLELAEQIAVGKIYPVNKEGDKAGCSYDPKTNAVTIPPQYKDAFKAYMEAGFTALSADSSDGGMGMPHTVSNACMEYFSAASIAFTMYSILTTGAANLVKNFAAPEQKRLYLPKMLNGTWGGTMCLTEPDAGSDVGALKTKAIRQPDGTYLISGQKIFISSGDNDLFENMIHPVLARIEGDPRGTRGISIFLVSKYHVNTDGSLGERNDVICSGIEHKMGIKGSATCTMSFGDNNRCVGYLMGEERQGMKIMFNMMNEARLQCSYQGLAVSSTAYMHAVTYAKNRKQMPHIMQLQNPDAPSVAIIEHPDVKRMLLWMKSQVEALRMISYFASYNLDLQHIAQGEEAKEAEALVDFLIPICKAGNTDMAWLVTAQAMQVYGGYGFCSDYPVEQFARDSKILTLYEGTNGIQSIDLITRKLLMNKEQYYYNVFKKRIYKTCDEAKGVVDYRYISNIRLGVEKMDEVIDLLMKKLASGRLMQLFMNATPLREAMVMLAHAWMHLWSLTIVNKKMHTLVGDLRGEERDRFLHENLEAAFYSGKVLSGQFYIGSEFQNFFGKCESILARETAVLKSSEAVFSGTLDEFK